MRIWGRGKGLTLPRWFVWAGCGALLCIGLAYLLLHYADYLAKQWAEATLAERGFESEIDVEWMGFYGADVESMELVRPGFEALAEGVSMRWHPFRVVGGRLDSVEIDKLWMALNLTEEGSFLSLNQRSSISDSSARVVYGSFVPVNFSTSVALPESSWLEQWWSFPVARFRAHDVEVEFDFGIRSMVLDMGLDLSTNDGLRRFSVSGSSSDIDFEMSLRDETMDRAWQAQLSWSGQHALDLWNQLLPEQHTNSVQSRLGRWLDEWEAESLSFEALIRGQGTQALAYSVLLEQGSFWARSKNGVEIQTNALSAGVAYEDERFKRAEVVVDFEYISFLGGQTRPLKVSVSGSDGDPLRIEIPTARWSRAGEMEVDLAMRAFLDSENETTELQLSILKAAWGDWSLNPFRWFLTQTAEVFSGRLSAVALERFPNWELANARFEGLASGLYTWSSDLEFVSKSIRLLSLSGTFEGDFETAIDGAAEIRDSDGFLLGEIDGRFDESGLSFEGVGQYPLNLLRQHMGLFYPDAEGVVGNGLLEWRLSGMPHRFFPIQAEVEIRMEDLNVRFKEAGWDIEGLSANLNLRAVGPFPGSKGIQEIRIAKLRSGQDSVDDVRIQFEWLTRDQLKVLKIEGRWMGGILSVKPFDLEFGEQATIHTVLRFDGIEAGRLFEDSEQLGFSVDARLHGSVPISYALGSQPKLNKGTLSLRSIDDAQPVLSDSLKIAGLLGLPDIANIRARVAKAIESDFRIHSLEISVFDSAFPEQPIRAVLVGSVVNEDVEIPHFEIVQSHRVDSALEGWQNLLFFFSGGTWSPGE